MKKLTAQQQAQVKEAMLALELGESEHSCTALAITDRVWGPESASELAARYANFYGFGPDKFWPMGWLDVQERREVRILLLLLFLEVNS